jgi:hypothetical protein
LIFPYDILGAQAKSKERPVAPLPSKDVLQGPTHGARGGA